MITPSTYQVSTIPSCSLPCRHDRPLTFFTWKIDHNSVALYQIPTKCSTEVRFDKSFMCIKFQLDQSMHSHFMGENANCVKWRVRRKKTKKLFWNFAHLYLGIGWHDLLQIFYIDSPSSGASQQLVWLNSGKRSGSYIGVKITFLVFLSIIILIMWCDGFLGCTPHYRVSWCIVVSPARKNNCSGLCWVKNIWISVYLCIFLSEYSTIQCVCNMQHKKLYCLFFQRAGFFHQSKHSLDVDITVH